jgi:hypothetical protein
MIDCAEMSEILQAALEGMVVLEINTASPVEVSVDYLQELRQFAIQNPDDQVRDFVVGLLNRKIGGGQ